ncbi:UDP-N-acetylglucosamine 4,6-dehydratase [Catalinimonas alkaloidigena]|uniref:polysaccharide biosynthesis protein n=1 Tax=Catalinimonas alkaloidigena TaxID=1075417 RepID=UPI002407696A|nr:polysaccharide biosynthesis protein [Catalinimonas alkaloidigena]MDF9798022.1 UDP-N-acetylglucosamine 4,6-dehydratase [Catalinimonas alkaloidigena]
MIKFNQQHLLITGGTGSYGQVLVKKLLSANTDLKYVTVFSRDEYKQYEMRRKFPTTQYPALQFMIGDIRDQEALLQATKKVDIVIHAAALKQNISGEQFSDEFIKTNVDGTRNLIKVALQNEVKQVLCLSTDKAVYPTTLYGASKLCAEKLLLAANSKQKNTTVFSVLRLGNLFGSRGSISSDLKNRLADETITITDPDMSRFSLTMEESIALTLKVLEVIKGGEIFIPKMDTYRLGDLMIALNKDVEIKSSGPRLTEKTHEIALSSEEARFTFEWENFYVFISPTAGPYLYWQKKGSPVPHDFEMNSFQAPKLSIEVLKRLIDTHI